MTRNPKNNSSAKRVAQDFETDMVCVVCAFSARTLQGVEQKEQPRRPKDCAKRPH
jgi:hypothetical protein